MRNRGAPITLLLFVLVLVSILPEFSSAQSRLIVFIRADGSVEPSSGPISTVDNVTYVFSDNFSGSIVVERDSVMIDGGGFTLQDVGGTGIGVYEVSNITIRNLRITGFDSGVSFNSTFGSILSGCSIVGNKYGVNIDASSSVIVTGNSVSYNEWWGVWLNGSSMNVVVDNDLVMNYIGIYVGYSWGNIFLENTVADGYRGIWLFSCEDNVVGRNSILRSDDSVWLEESSDNVLYENNVAYSGLGVWLYHSSNNTFLHNNFLNNTQQIETATSGQINFWDNGFEGNYWSNFAEPDLDSDGIVDAACGLDAGNVDYHPLAGSYHSFNTSYGHRVNFVSDSTISDFAFDLIDSSWASLTFSVSGETGIEGFCRIGLPRALINGSYVVRFDGEVVGYPRVRELMCSDEQFEYLYITYTTSDDQIEISGSSSIPESLLPIWLYMLAAVMFVTYVKKRGRKS